MGIKELKENVYSSLAGKYLASRFHISEIRPSADTKLSLLNLCETLQQNNLTISVDAYNRLVISKDGKIIAKAGVL